MPYIIASRMIPSHVTNEYRRTPSIFPPYFFTIFSYPLLWLIPLKQNQFTCEIFLEKIIGIKCFSAVYIVHLLSEKLTAIDTVHVLHTRLNFNFINPSILCSLFPTI